MALSSPTSVKGGGAWPPTKGILAEGSKGLLDVPPETAAPPPPELLMKLPEELYDEVCAVSDMLTLTVSTFYFHTSFMLYRRNFQHL